MNYTITFGQNAPADARGEYADGALTLYYRSGGADYILVISPEKVVHKTVGDGLSLEFVGGRRTVGTLRCGSSSAPYPIYCNRLKVEEAGGVTTVAVAFDDGGIRREINITVRQRL